MRGSAKEFGVMVGLLLLSMGARGSCSGKGAGTSPRPGIAGTPQRCPAPLAQLAVHVTAQECAVCSRLAVIAQSPQITAAIAAGRSPCATRLEDGPPGCLIGSVWNDAWLDCGGAACGPYATQLRDEFAAAASGAVPAITDTVAFCPFDRQGARYVPAGNCVSSVSQCDESATIALNIDGVAPPAAGDGTAGQGR